MREKLRRFNAFNRRYVTPVLIIVAWLLFFAEILFGAPMSVCLSQAAMVVVMQIAWFEGYV